MIYGQPQSNKIDEVQTQKDVGKYGTNDIIQALSNVDIGQHHHAEHFVCVTQSLSIKGPMCTAVKYFVQHYVVQGISLSNTWGPLTDT